jgi:hypothetical protein
LFFFFREEKYFQDAYLAEPAHRASIVVHTQPDAGDVIFVEDSGDEGEFPEVKMAGAQAPMEMEQKVRAIRVILREVHNGIVVQQAAAPMEDLPFAAVFPPHIQMPAPAPEPAPAQNNGGGAGGGGVAALEQQLQENLEQLQAEIDAMAQ